MTDRGVTKSTIEEPLLNWDEDLEYGLLRGPEIVAGEYAALRKRTKQCRYLKQYAEFRGQ